MRSSDHPAPGDLSARARIRDAAIACIIREGFEASVRSIAREAEVSGGLIEYHFGSKQALMELCDEHVLTHLFHVKLDRIHSEEPAQSLMASLATAEQAWIVLYLVRMIQSGGDRATTTMERIVDDTRDQFAEAERRGMVTPSRDPEARARWHAHSSVGAIVMLAHLHPQASGDELFTIFTEEFMLAALEAYTEPVLTDSSFLDLYLEAHPSTTTQETP